MSDHDEPRDRNEEEEPKRVLLSKEKDEAWEDFKARVKGTLRGVGILRDEDPRDAGDRGRRPG